MTKYAVYCEGEFQAEFDTLQEAQEYIMHDIKGCAEHYNKSQKWVLNNFRWEIKGDGMTTKNHYLIQCQYKRTGHISVRPIDAYSMKQAVCVFYKSQIARYGEIRYLMLSIKNQ